MVNDTGFTLKFPNIVFDCCFCAELDNPALVEQSAILSDFGKILGNCKTNGIIFYNLGYIR